MNALWRIELLGSLRATHGDRVVTQFRTQKAGSLLAYLAFHSRHPHPREALLELLWPELDLDASRNNLRFVLHSLRQLLEPAGTPAGSVLLADRSTVSLRPEAFTSDVAELEAALAAAGRAVEPAERAELLRPAVELYRGELLPGAFEPWVLTARQQVAESYLGALEQLAAALEQIGDLERAIVVARRAVAADPLREEAHCHLMRLYAAAGQPAATLRQYQELERLLQEELDETPSAATRALAEELRRSARAVIVARGTPSAPTADRRRPTAGRAPVGPAPPPSDQRRPLEAPAGPSGDPALAVGGRPSAVGTLPLQFTRFFGREEEIARLTGTLRIPETRLVTLTGPGGSGKTRLAIAAAGRLPAEFAGAVWFVPLASLTEARLIPDAILGALGLSRSGAVEPLEQVVGALQGRRALLVLDNFEQLVEEGAPLLLGLLARAPELTCLVTSRERLELAGEQELIVLPLPTPRMPAARSRSAEAAAPSGPNGTLAALMGYASVQLFADRARAARPEFRLTLENAGEVATLCDRLEGLPLAIELAAAWAAMLTPGQMVSRLERRFELLVSLRRDLPARHRTLWATLEWSYQLLSPALQRFFGQLSVFRGGWTLEAAQAVCDEPQALAHLRRLQESSLVVVEEAGGAMRYCLLETLREFAAEQLAPEEHAELGRRHAEFFLALAERAGLEWAGVAQGEWLERLDAEHDNLRAALAWSQSAAGNLDLGMALGGAMGWFWIARGYLTEGREQSARLLALERRPRSLQAPEAPHPSPEGRVVRARLLGGAGLLSGEQGDYEAAREYCQESLALYRQAGNEKGIAAALLHLGAVVREQGDLEAARAYFEEAVTIQRRTGAQGGIAVALANLGTVDLCQGNAEAARPLFEESRALYAQLRDKRGESWALHNLAMIARQSGDLASGYILEEQSLALRSELGDRQGIATCLTGFAEQARAEGQPERAARLLGAMEAVSGAIGHALTRHERALYEREVAAVRAALGEEGIAAARAAGRALTVEQAVAEALGRAGPPGTE
jgi:predicted ATPase/DNA-binding SARP family transcriptional activator